MRSTRFVLGILGILPLAFGHAAPNVPEPVDSWLVLERTATRTPEIVTVLRSLPEPSIRRKFPILLMISWGYQALPNGMPTEQELYRTRELYSALDRIVGTAGMYAMSRTGDGGRTMYYYVESASDQVDAIRKYFDAQPPISIKVTVAREPGWGTVQSVLDAVK